MDEILQSCRCAGLINLCYAAIDTLPAYLAIDPTAYGFKLRDVILADELGFKNVPVGILVEDLQTEEIVAAFRGTRVVLKGPDEWGVDVQFALNACPFAPGARTERGFTTTSETFHYAGISGKITPIIQLVTGHSLGAAWALLAAAKWKADLISFAGPRVGDRAFADFANKWIRFSLRWVNRPDWVPNLPEPVWPFFDYIHFSPANELDSKNLTKPIPPAWHSLDTYWHLLDPTHAIDSQFAA